MVYTVEHEANHTSLIACICPHTYSAYVWDNYAIEKEDAIAHYIC